MPDDLKDLLEKAPFEPFRIVTNSGEKYNVENPHDIALLEGRIFYARPDGHRWVFIRTNQITAFESLEQAA